MTGDVFLQGFWSPQRDLPLKPDSRPSRMLNYQGFLHRACAGSPLELAALFSLRVRESCFASISMYSSIVLEDCEILKIHCFFAINC